jgi:hypothetical protein
LGFVEPIGAFLRQRAEEGESFDKHVQRLMGIMAAEAPAEAQS